MKKRIIIGLAAFSLVLFLGGVYVLKIIAGATARLDNLVMLHQVEILREHFLIQVSRVQNDLTLKDTRHSREFDTIVSHVMKMDRMIDTCFHCHHTEPVTARIMDLKIQTEAYKDSLSRVLTIRAGSARLAQEQDVAFHVGERLINQVNDMIVATASKLEATTQESLAEIERSKYVLYVLVGLVPLVAAGLGWVFISGLSSPVNVLLRSTRKLQRGDLDHRVEGLKHEFGELGTAFNEMAGSLKEQMLKMQRTEQLVVLGELSAGLAHEIKNPLAGIKVAMEVLSEEADLSDEDRGVVRKVGQEVTRLETLMKSFLDFARPAKPRPTEVNVNALVNTTLTFYGERKRKPADGANGIEIHKEFGDLPTTLADPMQLQQVFLNLVINAIDAMPDGGTLRVRTAFDEDSREIDIGIADTGGGIDSEYADKIFEPFVTTKHGGTGLGLAISRQVIEQHQGSIAATANRGGGTLFTIRLPLRPVEADGGSPA